MRRPTVRMIRHPPSAVPTVRPAAQAIFAHVGAASVSIRPSASSSAAITPTDFWASLAPWLKASAADIPHCPALTGARQRRVAPARDRRSPADQQAAPRAPPSTGDRASAIRIPNTPMGRQCSKPPQLTACTLPSTTARADQPADQCVPRARRQAQPPGHEVPGHRRPQAGANHLDRHVRRDGDDTSDRVGDRCAEEQRPEQVEHRGEQDRLKRRRGPRGYERGDRVGRVVEPVRDGETDR